MALFDTPKVYPQYGGRVSRWFSTVRDLASPCLVLETAWVPPGEVEVCLATPAYKAKWCHHVVYADPAFDALVNHCPDWMPLVDYAVEAAHTEPQLALAAALTELLETHR